MIVIALIVSFIPAILLYFYLRGLKKEDPEYRADCRHLLVRGVLCSFAVAALALVFSLLWAFFLSANSYPLVKELFRTFILAAFVEEFVKYRTAGKTIRKNRDTVSWLDCISYTAIVGIGFQLIETVVYLVESNAIQTLVRGFTMGHPSYGMLMGYFTGKSIYTGKKHYKVLAFVLPFLLHGLYDFSLWDGLEAINDNLVFLPFILIFIELAILIRMLLLIRKERKGEEYTKPLAGTLLAFFLLLLAGCASKDQQVMDGDGMFRDTFRQISQEEAKEMMARDDGHVVVDVRRQDEYEAGHIPGAILIPNESIGTERPEELPDLDQIILIYCRSGNRSKQAAQKLVDMGYTNIYEFGGINDWTGEIVTGEDP